MSLYDDRTYENIMAELLEDFNDKNSQLPESHRVDASEGSLIWMALSKVAIRLEEAYADLDAVNDNMLVDTQDLEHLMETGVECGVPINEGTDAVVIAELNCECEEGDEFSAIDSDYNYIATELIEIIDNEDGSKTYRYLMQSDDDGVEPGSYRGEIEPEDYLEGFETGRITGVQTPGTEQEDEDEYRERRLLAGQSKACAGNRDYYMDTIGGLTGVGGVKVERRQYNNVTIPCYIQASDYGVPSESLIDEINEIMNPSGLEGEGMGLCPFGHILDIHPVEGVSINVSAAFTFDEGYSFAMLETAMRTAVSEYIAELAAEWKDSSSIVVRRAVVESKLLGITGIIDIADVTLNGDEENVTTTTHQVPILGTITEAV